MKDMLSLIDWVKDKAIFLKGAIVLFFFFYVLTKF